MTLCSAQPTPAYAGNRVFTYEVTPMNKVCNIQLPTGEVLDYNSIKAVVLQGKKIKVIGNHKTYSFSLLNEDYAIYYSQYLINEPDCLKNEIEEKSQNREVGYTRFY